MEQASDQNFLPRHPKARSAVENARKKIQQNREFIDNLKKENNVDQKAIEIQDKKDRSFELSQIRTSNGFSDFFKEMFSI